jgi:hypothetical protein
MHARFGTRTIRPSGKGRKMMAADYKERQAKLATFKEGDAVVAGGNIKGIFVGSDEYANALIRVGKREQPVNPLVLELNEAPTAASS